MPFRRNYRRRRRPAARQIQRAWKRYRGRKKRTTTSRVFKRKRTGTLRSRVKKLEGSTKKHYDYVLSTVAGQPLAPEGSTTFPLDGNISFSQMLSIQPYNGDGTVPPISGAARGTPANCRDGTNVYCTKVRLRGLVSGIKVNNPTATRGCVQTYPPLNTEVFPWQLQTALRQACQSRVHITILQDKFPVTLDPVTGVFEPNLLPVSP